MGKLKKILIIVFILTSLGFITRASSHGGIEVLKYVNVNGISHVEIQTPREIDHLVLEILNKEDTMTHYFILDYPLAKTNNSGIQLNHFYITKRMANFSEFHKIRVYPQNNEGKIYDIKEIPVIDMTHQQDNPSTTSAKKINIMSYNIHHGKNLTGKTTIDEMTAIIRESGVEIIGIQEADSGMPRTKFQNQMKYLGNQLSMNYVYGENLVIGSAKYGNGVLSKYPIVFSENIALPSGREPRGLLSTIIDIDGRKVHFLVTHLGLNRGERIKQIDVILNYIQTLPHDVILVGDFNAGPENDEMREIRKKMVDVGEITGKGNIPTFDLPVLSKRIDYIFLDQNIMVRSYDVIKSRASDHYPIHSEIILP